MFMKFERLRNLISPISVTFHTQKYSRKTHPSVERSQSASTQTTTTHCHHYQVKRNVPLCCFDATLQKANCSKHLKNNSSTSYLQKTLIKAKRHQDLVTKGKPNLPIYRSRRAFRDRERLSIKETKTFEATVKRKNYRGACSVGSLFPETKKKLRTILFRYGEKIPNCGRCCDATYCYRKQK